MGEVFKLNHCYNMDCLPAMELFPDNYFDLAVVDQGNEESDKWNVPNFRYLGERTRSLLQ